MGLVGDSVAVSYIAVRALERLVLPESMISGQEDVFRYVLKEFKSATTPEERYLYGRLMDAAGAATIAKSGIAVAIGKISQAKTTIKQSFAKGEMSKTSYETAAKTLDELSTTMNAAKKIEDVKPTSTKPQVITEKSKPKPHTEKVDFDKIDNTYLEKVFQNAGKEGGKYHGQYRAFLMQDQQKLTKSIKSFDELILKHESYIKDPKPHVHFEILDSGGKAVYINHVIVSG